MNNGLLENFTQIEDKLYLGDFFTSINYQVLIDYNITHILVCGEELSCRYPEEFTYKKLSIQDTPTTSIKEHFEDVYKFINNGMKRGSVLVHCAQAKSRSVSMVISYIMKKNRIRFSKAFEILKKHHPQAEPNSGFKQQLIQYEREIVIKNTGCINSIF